MAKIKSKKVKKHVTMVDIANAAGVSKSAVSKALNDKSDISDDVKKRIYKICEDMGYQINFRIQDMVKERMTGLTHNIAFVMSGIPFSDPAYSKVVDGIAKGVDENNLRLLLERVDGTERSIYDLPPVLRDHRVDGFLLSGSLNSGLMELFRKLGVPYVVLGTYQDELVEDCVSFLPDVRAGLDAITREMVEAGLSRIAFFTENIDNFVQKRWLEDLRSSLLALGVEFDDSLAYYGHKSFSGASEIMRPVFEMESLPFDGMVCLEHSTAIEISHFAYAHSRVNGTRPITIATSDVFGRHFLPIPAIYYDIRFSDIAYKGVETLVAIVNGEDVPAGKKLVPPEVR